MAVIKRTEAERIQKLQTWREAGYNPYPSKVSRSHPISFIQKQFDSLGNDESIQLVGRVIAIREHGGSIFLNFNDGTGMMQGYIKKDQVEEENFNLFRKTVDIGDFISVSGTPFVTQRGEKSILLSSITLITKSLRQLPEKWHGLQDKEARFRQRYLDLLMNKQVRDRFCTRTAMISAIRNFLNSRGFLEVETPTFQPVYGGGFARPFTTHHNRLNQDFYLRISDEMYLKRLIVGGFEKVYEITKVFRNEGIDFDHNPEFTMLEAQISYENYEYGMDLTEELFECVALETLGTTELPYKKHILNVKRPWKRYALVKAIRDIAGVDPLAWKSVADAQQTIEKLPIKNEKRHDVDRMKSLGEIISFVFEEMVEEKLIQPTIIYDYPVEVSPLAKKCKDERFAERFEIFAFGSELGNNYSELNDPIELKKRFVEEKKKEQAGFEEAHQMDEEYLTAIEYGFPPTCGLGIGIDRMAMLFTNAPNIKEVILFPTMRTKTVHSRKADA